MPTNTYPLPPSTASNQFSFPNDLIGNGRNFALQMQFVEYQRRSVFAQPFLYPKGGCTLPIPSQVNETQTVDWQAVNGGVVTAAVENLLAGNKGGALAAVGTTLGVQYAGSLLGQLGALVPGVGQTISQIAQQVASPDGIAAGLQVMGLAPNPFLTMLFKQPNFKEFQFSWTFAPNNAQESETLRNIIEYIRFNMLASNGGAGGAFLKYPNIAIMQFLPSDDWLFKFKPCAVAGMSVNWSGGGTPAFFENGAPPIVRVSIQFKEIEYWLQEDLGFGGF